MAKQLEFEEALDRLEGKQDQLIESINKIVDLYIQEFKENEVTTLGAVAIMKGVKKAILNDEKISKTYELFKYQEFNPQKKENLEYIG